MKSEQVNKGLTSSSPLEREGEGVRLVYFLGVGGIGMSALARYFLAQGCKVYGYDKTKTPLTEQLEEEGIKIHYQEDVEFLKEGKSFDEILLTLNTNYFRGSLKSRDFQDMINNFVNMGIIYEENSRLFEDCLEFTNDILI